MRQRGLRLIIHQQVRCIFILLARWRCRKCRFVFTDNPSFVLPYKRYAATGPLQLARHYLEHDRDSYRKTVRPAGMRIGYEAGNTSQAIDERTLQHSTVWRMLTWLGWLFEAWLSTAYHLRVHSQTEESPHQRYHADSKFTRQVDLNAVLQFFHQQYPRTVNIDFCDVRIDGQFYAVDAKLRGDRVLVHLDPFSPNHEAQLYSPTGTYLGIARRYQREKDAHCQPASTKNQTPIQPHYLDALKADHDAAQQRRRRGGIDYYSARQRNIWSFSGFAGSGSQ